VYSSTCAQLNYLHWVETSGVLKFVLDNLKVIETDMNLRITECRQEKERLSRKGQKRKRSDLCQSHSSTCVIYHIPVKVHFH
jgi:hypothetical protein